MARLLVVLLGMLLPFALQAETNLTGEAIVQKARANASGFHDMTNRLQMVLVNEKGERTEREMLVKAMVEKDGTAHSLSIFTAPQRERGIALLTKTSPGDGDEQWLYLPSTKRLKRITGENRSSSFRGSEFTFEDLSNQNINLYTFKKVGEEACGKLTCYVVDRFPKPGMDTSYSKTRLWIDEEHFRPMKADFYNKDGKMFKTMQAYDYSLYDNKFWKPGKVVMTNHEDGRSTELNSLELKINTGLHPRDFSELAVRSWR